VFSRVAAAPYPAYDYDIKLTCAATIRHP